MAGLIPDFGNIALTVAAFVVALSIIVAVHEGLVEQLPPVVNDDDFV